jgi:hypothetical protein
LLQLHAAKGGFEVRYGTSLLQRHDCRY